MGQPCHVGFRHGRPLVGSDRLISALAPPVSLVESLITHRQIDDAFNDADDSRNEGPTEQKIHNAKSNVPKVELVDTKSPRRMAGRPAATLLFEDAARACDEAGTGTHCCPFHHHRPSGENWGVG
jgi:hypothetical protein